MLNKKVCSICNKKVNKKHMQYWDKGIVWCVEKLNRETIKTGVTSAVETDGDPPEYCPYILEHLMEKNHAK